MDSKIIKSDDIPLIKEAIGWFIDEVKNDYIVKPFLDDPRFICFHSPWLEDSIKSMEKAMKDERDYLFGMPS